MSGFGTAGWVQQAPTEDISLFYCIYVYRKNLLRKKGKSFYIEVNLLKLLSSGLRKVFWFSLWEAGLVLPSG